MRRHVFWATRHVTSETTVCLHVHCGSRINRLRLRELQGTRKRTSERKSLDLRSVVEGEAGNEDVEHLGVEGIVAGAVELHGVEVVVTGVAAVAMAVLEAVAAMGHRNGHAFVVRKTSRIVSRATAATSPNHQRPIQEHRNRGTSNLIANFPPLFFSLSLASLNTNSAFDPPCQALHLFLLVQ